jgi:peptidoglycan/LPS O-acetylase OafA/YrhL
MLKDDVGECFFHASYMIAPSSQAIGRVSFMSGVRAIAVLLVLARHLWEAGFLSGTLVLPGILLVLPLALVRTGAVGVTVFFFVSGFALFYPYAQHLFEGRPLQTLAHYAQRRAAKILPSYWLALLFLTMVSILSISSTYNTIGREFFRHLLFIHSFWEESQTSINGPFWTLPIEVQYYVLFPLLAACFMKYPALTLGAMYGVHYAYVMLVNYLGVSNYALWIHQLPNYISIFGFGNFAAYMIVRMRNKRADSCGSRRLWTAAAWASGMLLYGLLCFENTVGAGEYSRAYIWWLDTGGDGIAIFLLILSLGLSEGSVLLRTLLENSVLLWISEISYNLYLWNKPAIWWYHDHVSGFVMRIAYGDTLNTIFSISFVLLISWALTSWVEKPILREGFGVVPHGFAYAASSTMAFLRRR